MSKNLCGFFFAFFALLLVSSSVLAATGKLAHTVAKKSKALTVTISFDNEFEVKSFSLPNPQRFVVDISGVVLPNGGVKGGETFKIDTKSVKSVRLSQNSRNPDVARIVFDLEGDAAFKVETDTKKHKLTVREAGGAEEVLEARTTDLLYSDYVKPVEKPKSRSRLSSAKADLGNVCMPLVAKQQQGVVLTFKVGKTDPGFTAVPAYNSDGSFTVKVGFPGFTAENPSKTTQINSGIAQRLTWTQDGRTAWALVRTKVPTSFDIEHDGDAGTLKVVVHQPSLLGRRICVDAGHGGEDPGAIGPDGTTESRINLDVALRLRRLLKAGGAKVTMTRDTDVFIPLSDRTNISNNASCELFISIHCNALKDHEATSPKARGSQSYYYSDTSKAYAVTMLAEMDNLMGVGDMGSFSRSLYVTRNTAMPAVLVELAFLTHSSDLALLKAPEFRENAARSLYNGLEAYLGMNSARMPAVKIPKQLTSLVPYKPKQSVSQEVCVQEPGGEGDEPYVEAPPPGYTPVAVEAATGYASTPHVAFAQPSVPPAKALSVLDKGGVKKTHPRKLSKYPKEPWNKKSQQGREVTLNK